MRSLEHGTFGVTRMRSIRESVRESLAPILKCSVILATVRFLLGVFIMPKDALSSKEWRQRLLKYAQGRFSFGRGQKPQRGSVWAQALTAIEKCPKHSNPATVDPFGRRIACNCGYHAVTPPASQVKYIIPSVNHGLINKNVLIAVLIIIALI